MAAPLSIHSFLLGARTEAAKYIPANPFYNDAIDRNTAERVITLSRLPILRKSSIRGCYAVTFICPVRRSIVHSLLDQKPDLSVEVVDLGGARSETFTTIYDLLSALISRSVLSPSPSSAESFHLRVGATADPVN